MIGQLGPRAAEILNESHCKTEDQLQLVTQQAQILHQFALESVATMQQLAPHIERYARMETLLTDPNKLTAFVVDYNNHVQTLPHVERAARMETLLTDADRLAAYTVDFFTHVNPLPDRPNAAASLVRPDFPSMPTNSGGNGQMRLANVRPDQRWMVADKMESQGLLQGKPIIVQ